MRCKCPIFINGSYYNCGSCLACRINYTSQWQLRLLYELDCWDGASFVTLTYNDKHLPLNGSLNKNHLRDFIKRLRSKMYYNNCVSLWNRGFIKNVFNKDYKPLLRYYACGEYGSKTNRPHYHLILFGVDYFNEEHMKYVSECWKNCDDLLYDKNLGRHCCLQPVNKDTIGYVTGYVQKKLKGNDAIKEYDEKGLLRPFNISSQGLGLVSAIENKKLLSKGYTYTTNGKRLTIPRYFRDKLEIDIKDKFNLPLRNRILDEFDYLSEEFNRRYPFYASPKTFNDCEIASKAFDNFCNSNEWTIARRFEKDFLQKSEREAIL